MASSISSPSSGSSTTSGSTQAVVQCNQLTKTFKDFWMRTRVKAVDGVTFDINQGEIFGLLGPNGSGKSTTIKIILGLLHKTSGRCAIFGKAPDDVRVKRRIGYLPEESYLYPFLNARETLDYYAKLFQLPGRERNRRIDELLDMVGLTAVQFRPVREYSKGMQRRIGLAQALINDPELLILDEPTTGLDPIGTRQVKDLIIELGRRGKTVLLSSHLLSDVEDCVDRMVILYGGRIQREGTCDSLLESTDRSIIETDALDEETIGEIDRVIREKTGGDKAISRVAHPRQRLEDLFVTLVEEARAEQQETSGAQHGGETAAFLKGEDLVESLVTAGRESTAAQTDDTTESGPDQDVLSSLIGGDQSADSDTSKPSADHPAAPAAPAPPKENVDLGVIGSLMDEDAEDQTPPHKEPGA